MKKAKLKLVEKLDLSTIDNQKFPWPFAENSVQEITCVGVFEFVPAKLRGAFMDEMYRVLVPEGKAVILTPYWSNMKGVQDYAYEWPPLAESSFLYFNKGWREANNIKRGLKCDFDFTYGYNVEQETGNRNDESRSFYIKRYTNSVEALHVVLTKRKKS